MKTFNLILSAALSLALCAVLSVAALSCKTSGEDGESSIPGIEVNANRTVYGLNEVIDFNGLELSVTTENGIESHSIAAANLSTATAPGAAQENCTITVTVNGLQGTFTIDVYPVVSLNAGTYTGYANLNAAFANANDGDTIIIYNNQTISSNTNPEGMTITLQGYGAERKITHTPVGSMFLLSGSGTTLVLGENITLDGEGADNYGPLISVSNNAVLVMEDGSTITGGKRDSGSGGGVYVMEYGTFTMSGGTISENEADFAGGGVYVYGGTFTMEGGAISGNTAGTDGGGVYVHISTFTMSGGAINDNEAGTYGGGVCVAVNGVFTYNTGTFTGNTAGTSGYAVYRNTYSTMDGGVSVAYNTPATHYETFPPD